MALIDREAPLRFLRTGYEPADWVAVFLKTYRTGETAQRVVSVGEATSPRFQSWLRHRNANSWNVYVSVNAVVQVALDRGALSAASVTSFPRKTSTDQDSWHR